MGNSAVGTESIRESRLHAGRSTGLLMVLIGATFWGLSGTAAQQLFQWYGFTPGWLVAMRMGISGLTLLVCVGLTAGHETVLSVWKDRRSRGQVVVFGLVGLVGVQYTYFASIHLGNAATATFLQYLAPAFIILYLAGKHRKAPSRREYVALVLAVVGTFLLVTNGSVASIVVPWSAVVWGILSAVALCFYTLYPGELMGRFGSAMVVGWAMLLGGVAMSLFVHPWNTAGQHWSVGSFLLVVFVVVFGTLIAFYLYLASMKFITPSETSLVASFEPLSAAIASVLWLHTRLGVSTVVGGLCILAIVVVLSKKNA